MRTKNASVVRFLRTHFKPHKNDQVHRMSPACYALQLLLCVFLCHLVNYVTIVCLSNQWQFCDNSVAILCLANSTLWVSSDLGATFNAADFPFEGRNNHFAVVDASEDFVFVCVDHNKTRDQGTITLNGYPSDDTKQPWYDITSVMHSLTVCSLVSVVNSSSHLAFYL